MLYLEHFGLAEPPFRITPHTDFFFDGADRGATLDALLYAILHDEGIVKVSGEVGSGKTMLCRVLMERLPDHVETVYLANPSLERDEILHAIADDLRVEFSQTRITVALRELLQRLIALYAEGRRVVILIDEAHAMPEDTLEQVRLLSNLESNRHKLLQIVLFGQPELDATLDKPSMRQLKDRITHSFRMRPLSEADVGKYLSFRMRAAGFRGPDVFSPQAVIMIAKAGSGLTRRINILADKALLAAFTDGAHSVSVKQARAAIRDSEFGRLLHEKRRGPLAFAAAALAAGLLLGATIHWMLTRNSDERPGRSPQASAATPADSPTRPPPSAQAQERSNPASDSAAGPRTEAVPSSVTAPETTPASAPSPPRLASDALKRISAYGVGDNKLLGQRIAATRERLVSEPDASYSIELFWTDNSDPARMERFLMRAKELVPLDLVFVLPQANNGRYRIRVTYGAFADREGAAQAVERLPPKYKQAFQADLRSFAELRAAL